MDYPCTSFFSFFSGVSSCPSLETISLPINRQFLVQIRLFFIMHHPQPYSSRFLTFWSSDCVPNTWHILYSILLCNPCYYSNSPPSSPFTFFPSFPLLIQFCLAPEMHPSSRSFNSSSHPIPTALSGGDLQETKKLWFPLNAVLHYPPQFDFFPPPQFNRGLATSVKPPLAHCRTSPQRGVVIFLGLCLRPPPRTMLPRFSYAKTFSFFFQLEQAPHMDSSPPVPPPNFPHHWLKGAPRSYRTQGPLFPS